LRRLSVDTDKCSSHVFRVTKADRLRDALDRFGRRFYAAPSQVGAKPFHHARRRGASLRPECAAELAQAHANSLCQSLDGERFGNMIAGIAKGSDNPVILWCQIDRSCELRLPAVATMIDDKVLCHRLGDGKTVVLLDQSQSQIDPSGDARRSPYVAVPTEDAICLDAHGWVVSLKACCVPPVRGRSTPVQQSSRREGECTCADTRNAPASARCLHKTALHTNRWGRIDRPAHDHERIEHGIIERCGGSRHAKAVRNGAGVGCEDVDSVRGISELVICSFKDRSGTGEVEHLKSWGDVKADRLHGRIIGKFDLSVKWPRP
jgi:hypothetical protein